MLRHLQYNAIILHIKATDSSHAIIDFLVTDGNETKLLSAFFFGLLKSKKHYGIRQFQTGTLWLYYNQVKNTYKVTDFKVTALRAGLTENLTRIWCVSFASELCIKMMGNISWDLVNSFFQGIEVSSENQCVIALLRFLWRVIKACGVAPDIEHCESCGSVITKTRETYTTQDYNSPLLSCTFNKVENSMHCTSCVSFNEGLNVISLSLEARLFLQDVTKLEPKLSRKINLTEQAIAELKTFLFFIIQQVVGQDLKTLKSPML